MPNIDINQAAEIIKRHEVEAAKLRAIIEDMNVLAEAKAQQDDEAPPAVKKQFAVLISDPDGRLPDFDFAAWVLQMPENESVATTQERIFKGAYDFNASKKGRLLPARTVGEALECVPAKHFKEHDVWVKTKTPVLVLRTDNKIPREMSESRIDRMTEPKQGLASRLEASLRAEGYDITVTNVSNTATA